MFVSLSDNTCANDVIDNDVTENDVIDSWMNTHTLLASMAKCGRVDATRRARCERGFKHEIDQLEIHTASGSSCLKIGVTA